MNSKARSKLLWNKGKHFQMSTKIDNTLHLKNFIEDINRADNSRQKEVVVNIETAKRLRNSLTSLLLTLVELQSKTVQNNDVSDVNMDGGAFK
tara:strand:- start:772 stop:1050 length:279 start_codon:yes stop_codon:yes gene_type:complete